MNVEIYYSVSFGKGDGTEDILYDECELSSEEERALKFAVWCGRDADSAPEIRKMIDEYEKSISESEAENLSDNDDEYAAECLGKVPVDRDDINDLVHDGDEYAIRFFGLEGLSEEELSEWDAWDLDEVPDVCDFYEDFEPENPFDGGYSVFVCIKYDDNDVTMGDDDAAEFLDKILSDTENTDDDLIFYIDSASEWYNGSLGRMAADLAESRGMTGLSETIRERFV